MLVALALFAAPQLDPAQRLSGPLEALVAPGDTEAFDVSPDGVWALYRAPQDSAEPALYLTRADGSTSSVRLSAPGASVGTFAFSPTGASIVYLAGGELFRVGASGQVVRLHPALQPGASVQEFAFGPDGARVLFRADVEVAGRLDLYSVNLFGVPQGVRLSRIGPAQGDVGEFWIAPGGQRVVFVGDLVVDTRQELFSAPLDGSQPDVALCGAFVAGGGLNGFTARPRTDGVRVLYLADQLTDGRFELFSVPLDASAAPVRLNGALPALGDVTGFQLAPAGGHVAFTADALVDERPELFTAPLDGSAAAVQVNGAVTPVSSFSFAPSGQRIAFVDRPCGGPSNQLWSVPTDGSAAPLQVSDHPASWRCVSEVTISADSLAAFYVLTYGSGKTLLRVPLDGSAAPLEILPPAGAQVASCRPAPDGLTLALLCEVGSTSTRVLAVAPADGSAPAVALHANAPQLLGPRDDLELVSGQVYFRADLERPDVLELYSAPLDASQLPQRLSDEPYLVAVRTDVYSFALSPDGTRLGYTTGLGAHALELDTDLTRTLARSFTGSGIFQGLVLTPDGGRCFWLGPGVGTHLYTAPFDGSGPVVQLSTGDFAQGFGATAVRLSPDGTRYTFAYSTYFGPGSVYLGPTDVSSPPVFLESSVVHGLNYLGAEIVYAWTQSNPYYPEPTYFYRRAADASTPPEHLLAPPPGWVAQGHLTATPDGTRVLLVRDQEEEFKGELYGLALASLSQPVKLNDALGPGRTVLQGVVPTPDSTRVLYLANRDVSSSFELYVVPVDGSAPPLELSGTMVTGGSVSSSSSRLVHVWVTPDSTHAVFIADALVDNRRDLYSVPLDGSAPPTLLVVGNSSGGSAVDPTPGSVQFSPDGTRVVFRGAFGPSGPTGLRSVPVAGGPVVVVGTPPHAAADVSLPYVQLADGRVVYRMDLAANARYELWIARGDRPGLSHRRSTLGISAGDVEEDFAVDAAGEWVYYRADARVDGDIELFRHPLDPPPYARRR